MLHSFYYLNSSIIINQYLYVQYSFLITYNYVYFCHETVNLTIILNFIGVKMIMKCDYDNVVGVIYPVENMILPIVYTSYLN